MPFLQKIRQAVGLFFGKVKLYLKSSQSFTPHAKQQLKDFVVKWWGWLLAGAALFALFYYPAGALMTHRIDMSMSLNDSAGVPKAVSTLEKLSNRELKRNVYTPNISLVHPGAALDNMPAFQTGIFSEIKDFTTMLAFLKPDSAELSRAAALFSYPPDIRSVKDGKPAPSSSDQYREATAALAAYKNSARATELSADELPVVILSLRDSLKREGERIENHIVKNEKKFFDWQADNLFYFVKGRAYVIALLLRDMKTDFPAAFKDETFKTLITDAQIALQKALDIQPLIVSNASPQTQFAPNHLLGLGFYLSRAQSVLTETEAYLQ